MNFFEGFCFGRGPNQAMRADRAARSGSLRHSLSASAVKAIGVLKARLDSAVPIVLSPKSGSTWFLFTDGALERGSGSVGAILYNEVGCAVGAFGSAVPQTLLNRLLAYSKNPIYELELLPVMLSFRAWGHLLRQGQVVSYVDNEAAKSSLIGSSGATEVAENIVEAIRLLEDGLQLSFSKPHAILDFNFFVEVKKKILSFF